jgi:predicted phosphodiesterase
VSSHAAWTQFGAAPTRLAALYDIHGNLPALGAVLAEIQEAGVDRILIGGDVAWGPMPRATVEALQKLDTGELLFVRGNADREVADRLGVADGLEADVAEVNQWCSDQLTGAQRAWLASWPGSLTAQRRGASPILFCHGSPRSDEETITAVTPGGRIAEMCEGTSEHFIVCGHTHEQFDRSIGDLRIVNAGSVGLPFGEPGAYWLLIDSDIEHRRTEYDYEAAAEAFRATGGPHADDFAQHVLKPPPAGTAEKLYG